MKLSERGRQLNRQSRIAGVWYLLLGLLSPLNLVYIPSKLIVAGDAAATAANLMAQEGLFRLGIVTSIAGQTAFLFAALAFYELFKSVHVGLARGLLVLVIASVPICILNLGNQYAVLLLLGGGDYLKVFDMAQIQALALFFLNVQGAGVHIVEVFWGLWLLPLGILVFKSRFFPKIFGVLLVIGCFGYLLDCLLVFQFPSYRAYFSPLTTTAEIISEIPFILWLLIRGARIRSDFQEDA
jgi:hypothetical protein